MKVDVSALAGLDPAGLSHDARIGLLESIEQARAALDAAQQRTLAALSRSDASEQQWVREEVALALRIAPATAASKLHDAVDLVDGLPATLSALTQSRIAHRHARVLVELTRRLDGVTRAKVEKRVLARAEGKTVSQFRQAVRRAVAALDPRQLEERHADAADQRRIVHTPQDDAMSEIWAYLPAGDAAELMNIVTGHAAELDDPADTRTADQKRADVLVGLARLAANSWGNDADECARQHDPNGDSTTQPSSTRRGPRVQVTIDASTLLGLDDKPGELAGHGPIPADMARAIAYDPTGTWRRILTDSAGTLIHVSRAYRPPPSMAAHVIARDRTCRFPGCQRAAMRCDLDHIRARTDGGPTAPGNLHALCPRHHHLKHEAPGWSVRRTPDGVTHWVTPTGRRHTTPPATYDVDDPAA